MVKGLIQKDHEAHIKLEVALKRLEKQYDYCVDQSSDQAFFASIVEYFNIIATNKYLSTLVDETIYPDKQACESNYELKSKKYKLKLEEGWKEIHKYLDQNGLLTDARLLEPIKDVKDFLAGLITVSGGEPIGFLETDIEDVLRILRDNPKHIALVKQFAKINESSNNIEEWFWVTKEADECSQAYKDIIEQQDINAWGSFDAIKRVYFALYRNREIGNELRKQGKSWEALSAWSTGQEMKNIVLGKPTTGYQHFKRDVYSTHLNRLHNRIVNDAEMIMEALAKKSTDENVVIYRPGQLIISNRKLPIRGWVDSFSKALFSMGNEAYDYIDEEDLLVKCVPDFESLYKDNKLKPIYKKKIWRIANDLNKRIGAQIGITDLFIVPDTHRVKVNSKYRIKYEVLN